MNSLLARLSSIAVTLSIASSVGAGSPEWLVPGVNPQISSAPDTAATIVSDSRSRLQPRDIFTVSGTSLLCASDLDSNRACADAMTHLEESQPGPTWVQFTPYVWATQVSGDLTVDGLTAPLEIDLSDLWEILENGEVRGGFMGWR